jgi:hypothetical protein
MLHKHIDLPRRKALAVRLAVARVLQDDNAWRNVTRCRLHGYGPYTIS